MTFSSIEGRCVVQVLVLHKYNYLYSDYLLLALTFTSPHDTPWYRANNW